MAIQFGNSSYVYKQIEHALLKEDENDDWQREQENDEEFDYLDAQINKNEKIKQNVRDKSLVKKSQAQILKQQQDNKDKKYTKEQIISVYWDAYNEGKYSTDKTADEYYKETFIT